MAGVKSMICKRCGTYSDIKRIKNKSGQKVHFCPKCKHEYILKNGQPESVPFGSVADWKWEGEVRFYHKDDANNNFANFWDFQVSHGFPTGIDRHEAQIAFEKGWLEAQEKYERKERERKALENPRSDEYWEYKGRFCGWNLISLERFCEQANIRDVSEHESQLFENAWKPAHEQRLERNKNRELP